MTESSLTKTYPVIYLLGLEVRGRYVAYYSDDSDCGFITSREEATKIQTTLNSKLRNEDEGSWNVLVYGRPSTIIR